MKINPVRDIMMDVCMEHLEDPTANQELNDLMRTVHECLCNYTTPNELLNPELYYFYMHLYKVTCNSVFGTVAWG